MASKRWWRIDFNQEAFGDDFSSSWDYIEDLSDPADDNVEIAAEFITDIVPLVNALQHDATNNVSLKVENRTDGYGPTFHTVTGTGDIVVSAGYQPSLQLALYFRAVTPLTKQFSDDQSVISRWIHSGKKYLSGVPNGFVSAGKVSFAYLATDVDAFQDSLSDTLVLPSGPTLTPIVHGYGLAASGEKLAREEVYAIITSGSLRRVSYLDGRDMG